MKFLALSSRLILAAALVTAQLLPADDAHAPATAVDLLIQKARSLEARDRADLAAQVWQQLLVANPNQPDALAGLARWAKRTGRNEEANAYLSRLRRVSPDSPALNQVEPVDAAHKNGGRLAEAATLAASGHTEDALRIYREVFGPTPPPGVWAIAYYETLASTAAGFDPAVNALKDLAASYPGVPAYQVAAGKLMTYRPATRQAGVALLSSVPGSSGEAPKAREAWRQALLWEKSNPAYEQSLQAYLSRYSDPELSTVSATLQTQAAKMAPLSSDSREEQLGYQAMKNGDMTHAEQEFNAALARNSASARAHAGMGFVRLKAGDFDEAVRQFEAAHKASPADATIRNFLDSARFWQAMRQGAKSADEGKWSEAVAHYKAAAALRPGEEDAIRALGGALAADGSSAQAIPYLARVVRAKPMDESSWCALLSAKLDAEGAKAAVATIKSVPESVATVLDRNLQWRVLQASVYSDGVDNARALEIYHQLLTEDHPNLTADEQIQLAGLALHFHEPAQALPFARKAVEEAGGKPGAWEVLLPALIGSGRPEEAERVYTLMPAAAQKIALTHPAFLETLASMTEAGGDLEGARKLLEKSLALTGNSARESDQISTKLQLAQLLAKQGRGTEAETLVAGITESNPKNVDAWRTRLLILQALGRQNEIVGIASGIPQPVAQRLSGDGDMVTLLARAHAAAGDTAFGVKMLEAYIARANAADSVDLLPARIQLAWLLLNSPGGSGGLYGLLDGLNARTDLTADQRKEVTSLWTTWILRSAEMARKGGNEARCLGLLQQGYRMFPNNVELERGFAGDLLSYGKTKAAFAVYSNWGLIDAQAEDYAGAIGAALANRNMQYADSWIDRGLARWPNNPKLLELAGEGAQAHGDLKKAEAYWKEALAQKQSQSKDQVAAGADVNQPSLKSLLSVDSGSDQRSVLLPLADQGLPQLQLSSFHGGGVQQAHEDFVRDSASMTSDPASRPLGQSAYLMNSAIAPAAPVDSLEDKLAAVESRDTPFLDSGMSVWGRSGQGGFSSLLIEQSQFEASRTLTDSLRVSFLLEPTYLAGGTANGSGDSLFGRQTSVATFGNENASGLAAEAQFASDSFGLRIGATPQGFLTRNLMGGLRLRPKKGPITIVLERDSVKDTLLSYAGARDPLSGQIWGGVMANTASIQGRWGDDRSGMYVNGGYQLVEGLHVARNTGVNGNLGTWWKIASLPEGNLTIGMNFSAMHYAENLRYFTFGQGGYFSPQQYFLFNAPVRWTGVYNHRLQYIISGSLGVQHFIEDGSDYYPTDAALQAATGYRYQAFENTGANFNLDARLNYQLAPHWMLGAFATANNARDYTSSSAGLFAKYTFEPRPMSFDSSLPSVPDWRGQQPFSLY